MLVTGATYGFNQAAIGCSCLVGVLLRHATRGVIIRDTEATVGNAPPESFAGTSLSLSWVFPVDAGVNTFSLDGQQWDGTAMVEFVRPRLTALFVPFGPDGGTTLQP